MAWPRLRRYPGMRDSPRRFSLKDLFSNPAIFAVRLLSIRVVPDSLIKKHICSASIAYYDDNALSCSTGWRRYRLQTCQGPRSHNMARKSHLFWKNNERRSRIEQRVRIFPLGRKVCSQPKPLGENEGLQICCTIDDWRTEINVKYRCKCTQMADDSHRDNPS
jgi:hypothetical protein